MTELFYEQRPEEFFMGPISEYPFPSHLHEKIEIVCLTAGTLEMTIGNTTHMMVPGDIAMAFPLIPHRYNFVPSDARGLTIIFSPNKIREYETHFRLNLPTKPFLRGIDPSAEIHGLIKSMMDVPPTEDSPLRTGYLHLFLAHLFSLIELQPIQRSMQSGMYYRVLQYISEHFTEPLSLESTAKALGISRIHLSHIFSQQLHINFRQYINTLRIEQGCAMLRDPQYSISQIAYLCGYGNPRTFHRAFLSQCQMSPKEYRSQFLPGHKEPT